MGRKQKYLQGRFKPNKPEKYMGNVDNIIFRSSLELKLFIFCDTHDDIIKWGSEEIVVPYINPFDGRYHRYFTDIYIERMENGKIKKYLGEVKPASQCKPPKKPKRKTKSYMKRLQTFLINKAKWDAAHKYSKEHDMQFVILTENHKIMV